MGVKQKLLKAVLQKGAVLLDPLSLASHQEAGAPMHSANVASRLSIGQFPGFGIQFHLFALFFH